MEQRNFLTSFNTKPKTIYPKLSPEINSPPQKKSVFIGGVWMTGISLLLFFAPIVNGLFGGIIGGYKIGTPKRALLGAILPCILVAAGLWLVGFFVGITAGTWILLSDVGLLLGATIGGKMAQQRENIL